MGDGPSVVIEEWDANHPQWPALRDAVAARRGTQVVGFLRFVIQEIGPDMGCTPLLLDGVALTEAKVLAFAVDPAHQQQGIGRALQEELLRAAKARGCYQVRSHSSGDNAANHHLKLAMGFGVHPMILGADTQGVYFVMPLATLSV